MRTFGLITSVLLRLHQQKHKNWPTSRKLEIVWINIFTPTSHFYIPWKCQKTKGFLYPLKTSENQRFSNFFRGYRIGTLAWKGLIFQVSLMHWLLSVLRKNLITFEQEAVFQLLFQQQQLIQKYCLTRFIRFWISKQHKLR